MKYLTTEDFFTHIFKTVRDLAYDDVEKPIYENEKKGIKKLESILELIKNNNYYPSYYKKAAYLFTSISTGHYFSNGNKRLALAALFVFNYINDFIGRSVRKEKYKSWFKEKFPNYELDQNNYSSNLDWAAYNYSKAINIKEGHNKGHIYSFDELKDISEEFIKLTTIKKIK